MDPAAYFEKTLIQELARAVGILLNSEPQNPAYVQLMEKIYEAYASELANKIDFDPAQVEKLNGLERAIQDHLGTPLNIARSVAMSQNQSASNLVSDTLRSYILKSRNKTDQIRRWVDNAQVYSIWGVAITGATAGAVLHAQLEGTLPFELIIPIERNSDGNAVKYLFPDQPKGRVLIVDDHYREASNTRDRISDHLASNKISGIFMCAEYYSPGADTSMFAMI